MRRLAALVLITLAACSDVTEVETDVLRVRTHAASFELINLGDRPVYYLVAEREILALLDWIPCTDPAQGCPSVPAGETTGVPFATIIGYNANAKEAVVFHWKLVANGTAGFRVDSIRAITVRFPR